MSLKMNSLTPHTDYNYIKNMWIMWCWLPIPILSIILGFKYKREGFKCQNNISLGIISSLILLVYGSFCMFPTYEVEYNSIDNYRDIISAEIPNNGELTIQHFDIYFDADKTDYTLIKASYYDEDVSNLVNSIESSSNWILSKETKSELKIFIPSQLKSDDDAYFSIYNKTLEQYNILPDKDGEYEIYAMKYDKSDRKLEIHIFKYYYKS